MCAPRVLDLNRLRKVSGLEDQCYGSVPQASRSIYAWHVGFSTGEVTDFDPAVTREDDRWAIELLGYVVRSEPDHRAARELSAEAHRRQALQQENATWRNWDLAAAELDGILVTLHERA